MQSTKIITTQTNNSSQVAQRKIILEGISLFSDNFFKINPSNSGVLASLARLLAGKRANCGCLYIETQEDNSPDLYFSSNQFPNLVRTQKYSQLTEEILTDLSSAIKIADKENSKIKVIKLFVRNMIVLNTKKDEKESVLRAIHSGKDSHQFLAESIKDKIFSADCQWSIENFQKLKEDVDSYISKKPVRNPSENKFRRYVFLLGCYLQDVANLTGLIDERNTSKVEWEKKVKEAGEFENEVENCKILTDFFKGNWEFKNIQTIKQDSSDHTSEMNDKKFHCECRIFEHVLKLSSDGKISLVAWKKFLDGFLEKRLVISKPCCFYCHNFLLSVCLSLEPGYIEKIDKLKIDLEKKFGEEDLKKLDIGRLLEYGADKNTSKITKCLGNSARVFPWISASSLINPGNSLDLKTTTFINRIFETICECFEIRSGVLDFINETSEALEFQIEYSTPAGHAPFGWR